MGRELKNGEILSGFNEKYLEMNKNIFRFYEQLQ